MPVIHCNQLSAESSPYLLQHAANPVHWFAWGEDALSSAKAEDKPILVSIGYAACHWCHVMERESFENEETAAIMNRHFINIKIDREERPDLDHIYMEAVQAIAGNGGWPLNVFLTPDGKPFYGGTYFPPQKAYGRNSWTDILHSISDAWNNRRSEIEAQAAQLTEHIGQPNSFANTAVFESDNDGMLYSREDCQQIVQKILANADTTEGGFGAAPKFPQTFSIQLLLQHAHFFNDMASLAHAELSLQKMIQGGIYDQLGGGMSRYSTDTLWLAPHFEKMLYDNALLVIVLCDAYQLTKKEIYSSAIRKTLAFLITEMKDASGGFYSAIDADSEGKEGKFYIWYIEEIQQLLGDEADIYSAFYDISTAGNWEQHNILNIKQDLGTFCVEKGLEKAEFSGLIERCNAILLEARNKRIRPITDDKILLGWNALLLTALSRSYAAVGETSYKEEAEKLYNFITTRFSREGSAGLYHTFKNGISKFPAFLDDYAYLIQSCIAFQEISGNEEAIRFAERLTKYVDGHFKAEDSAFYYYTDTDQDDIVIRKTELFDSAIPSGNAIMLSNLYYLSNVFDNVGWKQIAEKMIWSLKQSILNYPSSFSVWSIVLQQQVMGTHEIVVTGNDVEQLLKDVISQYIPNKILQSAINDSAMPLLAGKDFSGRSLIYVCEDYQCFEPVKSAPEMMKQLKIRTVEK